MNSKKVIIGTIVIILIVILCAIVWVINNKAVDNNKQKNETKVKSVMDQSAYEDAKKSAISFKIKNLTGKEIQKIYIKNNTEDDFSVELVSSVKDGKEVEVKCNDYSSLYIWDFKIIFEDNTVKTLSNQIAANIIYDGAVLELVDLEDTVNVINRNAKPVETDLSENENLSETESEEEQNENIKQDETQSLEKIEKADASENIGDNTLEITKQVNETSNQ